MPGRHQPSLFGWMWGASSQGIPALRKLLQHILRVEDFAGLRVNIQRADLPQWAVTWRSQPNRDPPKQTLTNKQAWALAVQQVAYLIEQQFTDLALGNYIRDVHMGGQAERDLDLGFLR